jgi:hypothetical protein
MRCLTPAECAEWCRRYGYPVVDADAYGRPSPDVRRHFAEIKLEPFGDMGELVVRARQIMEWMTRDGDVLLWVQHWAVWSSLQHIPLFTRFRQGVGEPRTLLEAPGHVITAADLDDGISVLAMALWFLWDCAVFSERRGPVFVCSYDAWDSFFIPPDYDRTPLLIHIGSFVKESASP